MSVTLEVMLLAVALLVVVGGIGVALALRTAPRRSSRHKGRDARPARRHAAAGAGSAAAARPAAPVKIKSTTLASATAAPVDPEQAHQAKLAALQALLAQGDGKGKVKGQDGQFADTEPTDHGYASTEFVDRADPPTMQISLLNLDKAQPRRKRP